MWVILFTLSRRIFEFPSMSIYARYYVFCHCLYDGNCGGVSRSLSLRDKFLSVESPQRPKPTRRSQQRPFSGQVAVAQVIAHVVHNLEIVMALTTALKIPRKWSWTLKGAAKF